MSTSLRLVFAVVIIGILLNGLLQAADDYVAKKRNDHNQSPALTEEFDANSGQTELPGVPEATSSYVPWAFPAPSQAPIDPFQGSGPDSQIQIPANFDFELEPWTPEVMEMHEPGVHPLFTVDRVESENGQLNIYIMSSSPDDVAAAIEDGKLTAQLSEHEEDGGGTASAVGFRFMKKAKCGTAGEVIFAYEDELPSGCPAEQISFFFALDPQLGPWRDLAFGYDPYSLWLVR